MKTFLALLLGLCSAIAVVAQAPSAGMPAAALRTPEELDQLLGPIALYPDPLVALILPAATVPADIARAADFLNANGDPNRIAGQSWDESVKSLAHYPDVLKWMNANLPWTQQVGDAFLAQQADVLKSIQQLRASSVAAGSLTNTPQQQVIMDGNEIRIVPAQSDVVYVPEYDPNLVYGEQPGYAGPWMTFGVGFPAGVWLNYDLNWDDFGIWIGTWHPGYDYRHPPWRHAPGDVPVNGHAWRAVPGRQAVRPAYAGRVQPEIALPKPFPGAPLRPSPVVAPGPRPGIGVRPDLRGYPAADERPAMRPSSVFGGYNRGSDARAFSQRGQMSRQTGGSMGRSGPPAARGNPGGSGGGERRK